MKQRKGMSLKESSLLAGLRNKKLKKERIIEYNENPILCKCCKKPLSYEKRKNKFCNHSCSATMNNLGCARNFKESNIKEYLKNKDKRNNYSKKQCLFCQKITYNYKFCSQKCTSLYKKRVRREKIISTNMLINQKDKWFLIEIRGHKCEYCKYEIWQEKPIPLDVHHEDGNSDNNDLSNVKLICPNCHRQTGNHGNKNKNGKYSKRNKYRNERYKLNKSY